MSKQKNKNNSNQQKITTTIIIAANGKRKHCTAKRPQKSSLVRLGNRKRKRRQMPNEQCWAEWLAGCPTGATVKSRQVQFSQLKALQFHSNNQQLCGGSTAALGSMGRTANEQQMPTTNQRSNESTSQRASTTAASTVAKGTSGWQ